jgi:phosphatidylinositol-3,4,5-trisphosphate 3-phosphatase/dual-specificity protein phosphatase PTEN
MAPFCREVHEYLETDPRNVVAVHCKAGKGRTGVMICAYLCYINFYNTPRQNMDYYSIVRTHNNKGVTIPSQRRYVYYFNHLRQKKLNYMPLKVELVGIYIEKPPKVSGAFSKGALKVRVANGDVDVFDGEDLWISNEMYDEEDRMHKKCPVMAGNDHYDPNNPKPGNECISRRCYGWTVPPNKRVFIEGDVRVDLYHKSQIKVLNVVSFLALFCV